MDNLTQMESPAHHPVPGSGRATLFLRKPAALLRPKLSGCIGRLGSLELHLAATSRDVHRAQELRHQVFFSGRTGSHKGAQAKTRDQDAFDAVCDHLLVIDTATGNRAVVGTYRLLRQDVADGEFGFYSESEFHIRPLLERQSHLQFLELGRSCVLPAYRERKTIELLWQGLWRYVQHHGIGAMMGCASFDGTQTDQLTRPLSFLLHEAQAERNWSVHARPERRAAYAILPREQIDGRTALREMPPLIKGYLRAGARFSAEAVTDHIFGTTDVFVVMPTAAINQRYIDYFSSDAHSRAA